MRVAIAGASGLIGTTLTARLTSAGHEVVAVRRGPSSDPTAMWNPAVGWIRDGALSGFDAVVNLAGESIGQGRWSTRRRQALRASRIDSTRLLIDHLGALPNPPRVYLGASAIGYYGNRADELLDEGAAPGNGFLADLVRDWEAEHTRAGAAGMRTTILRFGVVLSSDGGVLQRMLLPFRLGIGGPLGSGRQYFSWVSMEDTVGAIEFALTHEVAGVFNVTAPQPVTNREFTRALGRALRRPAFAPIPPFALRLLFGGSADELLLWGQRVVPAGLRANGYAFVHSTVESALRAALGRPAHAPATPRRAGA